MVISSPEGDSGGARDGVIAVVAIAVVLFFVIRIYVDYVTATGQAVKRGAKRSWSSSRQLPAQPDRSAYTGRDGLPETETAGEDPWPPGRGSQSERTADSKQTGSTQGSWRQPPHEGRSVSDGDPGRPAAGGYPGQIVIEKSLGRTEETSRPAAREHTLRIETPPAPRTVDEVATERASTTSDTGAIAHHVSPESGPKIASFRENDPYPAAYDSIRVGDRLSDLNGLRIPGGRLSRSVYSYRPRGGPFKIVHAVLSVGPADPVVTGVVYLFRSAKAAAAVRREAVSAFGEAASFEADRVLWPHLNGLSVSVDPDRYSVEEDLTPAARRRAR